MKYALYGLLATTKQRTVGNVETDFIVEGSQTPLHFATAALSIRQIVIHSVVVLSIWSMGHRDHLDLYETSITQLNNY
jgi:hypothetical protein